MTAIAGCLRGRFIVRPSKEQRIGSRQQRKRCLLYTSANFQKLYPQYRIDITAAESDEQTELALTELGAGKGYDMYPVSYTNLDVYKRQICTCSMIHSVRSWMTLCSLKT